MNPRCKHCNARIYLSGIRWRHRAGSYTYLACMNKFGIVTTTAEPREDDFTPVPSAEGQ